MKILVVGAGIIGTSLISELAKSNHSISVVDGDAEKCNQISDKLDVMVVCGKATSPKVLKDTGIEQMDMVIAVTDSDEKNIVVCGVARIFGVSIRIASLRGGDFPEIDITKLGVTHVISPERVVANTILQFVESPGASDCASFDDGNILVRGYKISEDMPINGKKIMDLKAIADPHVLLVVTIIRNGKTMIPTADQTIQAGDEVFTILPRSSLETYLKMVNRVDEKNRKIVVFGDDLAATYLTERLSGDYDNVTLVDPDISHAGKAAERLDRVQVLYGDCTDADILKEIRVGKADLFIAVAKKREDNIMAAMLAKTEGAREIIAVYNKPGQEKLFQGIGIHHLISLQTVTAREIMEVVHHGQIGSTIGKNDANIEVFRILVGKKSRATAKPIQKVWKRIREDAIIGAVVRDDIMLVPQGDMTLEEKDIVIVFSNKEHVNVVQELFKAR